MTQEIERKFIVDPQNEAYQQLIKDKVFVVENRYYLYKKDGIELRFTSLTKSNAEVDYTFDRMEVMDDSLTIRTKQRWQISKPEFDSLLALLRHSTPDTEPIIRHSYTIGSNPTIQIKVYGGRFDGLVRAEVEFESVESCLAYQPEAWMGTDISSTQIGDDIALADLTPDVFKSILAAFL